MSLREKARIVGYAFILLAFLFYAAVVALSGRASGSTVNTLALLGGVCLVIYGAILILSRRVQVED